VRSEKSFGEKLRSVYRTATVDNSPVSCIVTHLQADADADSCLDSINSIVVSSAVHLTSVACRTLTLHFVSHTSACREDNYVVTDNNDDVRPQLVILR